MQDFIGEGGNFERPKAVVKILPVCPAGSAYAGCEAVGGLHFKERILAPGETAGYTIMIGAVRKTEHAGGDDFKHDGSVPHGGADEGGV